MDVRLHHQPFEDIKLSFFLALFSLAPLLALALTLICLSLSGFLSFSLSLSLLSLSSIRPFTHSGVGLHSMHSGFSSIFSQYLRLFYCFGAI